MCYVLLRVYYILSLLIAVLLFTACTQKASITMGDARALFPGAGSRTTVGIIRWDAWSPHLHPTTTTQQKWLTASLTKWHYRLPFFAAIPSVPPTKDTDVIIEDKQDIIDKEILCTATAGIDYWAFYWFDFWWQNKDPSWRYNYALNSYLQSPHKSKINFALILGCCGLIDRYPTDWEPKVVPKIVKLIKDDHYQKVMNGRPLLFVFGADNLARWFNCGYYDKSYGFCADKSFNKAKAALDHLRAKIQQAGLPNPYLVAMVWDPENTNYTSSKGYGFDAISSYSGHNTSIQELTEKTYAHLIADNDLFRAKAKAAGSKLIPPVNTGWDRRPDPNYKKVWYHDGQPQEVADNVARAIHWNISNPSLAEAQSILIYAWNEFVEGGWVGPTLDDKGARLNAIADVIGGQHVSPAYADCVQSPPHSALLN